MQSRTKSNMVGILQQKIDEIKSRDYTKPNITQYREIKKVHKRGNTTADDILRNPDEVDRLSQYIDDKFIKKIITKNDAIKYGIEKIGTKNDHMEILDRVLESASTSSKKIGAKYLIDSLGSRLSNLTFESTKGTIIKGLKISKNAYLKTVSYTRNGKTIKYLQARNIKTGRVISYKSAKRLKGKGYK